MFLKSLNIFVAINLITIILSRSEATKCGDFFCRGESECRYSYERGRLECACAEGFAANITGNVYFCYPAIQSDNEAGQCLKSGDTCGPKHNCNQELICVKEHVGEGQSCAASEENCLERCCLAHEVCSGGICIIRLPDLDNECPEAAKCLSECCAENEVCSEENVCVLRAHTIADAAVNIQCQESKKCLDTCCQENEVCENGSKCVFKSDLLPGNEQCPASQKCLDKCCSSTQFCSTDWKCVDDLASSATTVSTPFSITQTPSFSVQKECPSDKMCLDSCCHEEEKCSRSNVCIPINTIECIETDVCGDKCCPINQTCNAGHECVQFLELPAFNSCPKKQQCLNKCCRPTEVCNELNECVARVLKKELVHYVTLPSESAEAEPDFDAIFPLTGLKNHEPTLNCQEDDFVCQNICCSSEQTCSPTGECVDTIEADHNLRVCESGRNCTETGSATEATVSLAYTIIGLGCLVLVLSFALFKVHAFRRSNRIV